MGVWEGEVAARALLPPSPPPSLSYLGRPPRGLGVIHQERGGGHAGRGEHAPVGKRGREVRAQALAELAGEGAGVGDKAGGKQAVA